MCSAQAEAGGCVQSVIQALCMSVAKSRGCSCLSLQALLCAGQCLAHQTLYSAHAVWHSVYSAAYLGLALTDLSRSLGESKAAHSSNKTGRRDWQTRDKEGLPQRDICARAVQKRQTNSGRSPVAVHLCHLPREILICLCHCREACKRQLHGIAMLQNTMEKTITTLFCQAVRATAKNCFRSDLAGLTLRGSTCYQLPAATHCPAR